MLEVKLLGQFEVILDGKHITIPTRNAQSLFAYLILSSGNTHRRERLAGLLWPDSSEENARSNLRHELWRLRKALLSQGDAYFLTDDLTIAFNPHSQFSLDVHILENAPLEGGSADELIQALDVYHDDLLPGFYEEWVFVERQRLNALFEARIARLLDLLQDEGRWPEVKEWSLRWLGFGQWSEPAYRALMAAYANTGEVAKAVATYERFAQVLQKELGTKPSEQTQALYKQLKSGWKPYTKPRVPGRTAHDHVSQVDITTSVSASSVLRRSNLPRPLTSFIGREKEILLVKQLLSQARLVNITGSAGIGKTRLAIQVAGSMMPDFQDGVWWVELASLTAATPTREARLGELQGADLIAQAVMKILWVHETPGLSLVEGLVEYLHDRQLLLVLDNCEHLIVDCAALVESLLSECPRLTVLTTSREALGVLGEKTWQLPTLSLPEVGSSHPAAISHSEAVRLFVERTGDNLPGYQLNEADAPAIAQICLNLDGIPLAIELAAARMNLLSSHEIAARLDRRFTLLTGGSRSALPRHQTLLAAIEWSYDLLGEPERVLFRRLSIFPGSFTLEAAEAISYGDVVHNDEVLTLVSQLVDKSLLNVELANQNLALATRYHFLDSIRSFGRLKLEDASETQWIRDRHADYYTRLAVTVEPELLSGDQGQWYRLLQQEYGNIRATIEWSAESEQAERALRVAGALLWFWWSHGSIREGLDLVLKALAVPSPIQFQDIRARALNTAVYLLWVLGDINLARQFIEEALSLLRTSTDDADLAWSLQFSGLVLSSEGEYDQADRAMKDAIDIAYKLGDLNILSFSLFGIGDTALRQGNLSKAKRSYDESVDILKRLGNKLFLAYPLRRLGYVALEQEQFLLAWDYFSESLTHNFEGDDQRAVVACLTSMAALALRIDEPVLAARLYGTVEKQLESLSINLLYLDQLELDRVRSQLLASLDEATFEAAFKQGWDMSVEQAIELAELLYTDKVRQYPGTGTTSSF